MAPSLLSPFTLRDVEDLAMSDPEASLATGVMATREDISALLPEIIAPCLVVVGAYDVTSPPRQGRLAAARIPGARLLELPTRHHPFAERPDLFYPAVVDFLRS
jgi:3-oxoadipate enol-lactonase